jgi:hypothetical protein
MLNKECDNLYLVVIPSSASDCLAFPGPVNGWVACEVDRDQRQCAIGCHEGFGNAIGDNEYTCQTVETSFWQPRPNTDICVGKCDHCDWLNVLSPLPCPLQKQTRNLNFWFGIFV